MSDVLARRDQALNPEETVELLRDRLGEGVLGSTVEYATFTVHVAADAWVEAATRCRDEPLLAFDLFDCLFGIDARDEGFDVVAVLYSTSTGNRVCLRARCAGGREQPRIGSITDVYRGANWMEREAWDMFGIEFEGHPGLEPRILTVENFDGWPLRKDFPLTSRVAKPWPGVAEPQELDEDGNVIEREGRIGDAPGPYELDKAMAEQAKRANPATATETLEGELREEAADEADTAEDSGQVLAGAQEQAAEDAEATATTARERAEQRRKEQAEARARKAAERVAETQERDEDEGTEPGGEEDDA